MPCNEFDQWWDYFKWKAKEAEKATKKANNNNKGSKRITKL